MLHVALLRAVNLGGHNKVPMADLRALLADVGFEQPRSLLQSGNVVFGAEGRTTRDIEALLEKEAEKRLGLSTAFFVRTASEWASLVDANPFPQEAESDPSHLVVLAAKDAPNAAALSALRKAIRGRETVDAVGRQAYVVYPDGIGRSKLTTTVIERHLGTRVTGRNWNTTLKLLAML